MVESEKGSTPPEVGASNDRDDDPTEGKDDWKLIVIASVTVFVVLISVSAIFCAVVKYRRKKQQQLQQEMEILAQQQAAAAQTEQNQAENVGEPGAAEEEAATPEEEKEQKKYFSVFPDETPTGTSTPTPDTPGKQAGKITEMPTDKPTLGTYEPGRQAAKITSPDAAGPSNKLAVPLAGKKKLKTVKEMVGLTLPIKSVQCSYMPKIGTGWPAPSPAGPKQGQPSPKKKALALDAGITLPARSIQHKPSPPTPESAPSAKGAKKFAEPSVFGGGGPAAGSPPGGDILSPQDQQPQTSDKKSYVEPASTFSGSSKVGKQFRTNVIVSKKGGGGKFAKVKKTVKKR